MAEVDRETSNEDITRHQISTTSLPHPSSHHLCLDKAEYIGLTQSGTEIYRDIDWNVQSAGCRCGADKPRPHRRRHLLLRLGLLPRKRSSIGVQAHVTDHMTDHVAGDSDDVIGVSESEGEIPCDLLRPGGQHMGDAGCHSQGVISPEGISCIVDTQFGEDFVTNQTSNVYAQEIASLQAQLDESRALNMQLLKNVSQLDKNVCSLHQQLQEQREVVNLKQEKGHVLEEKVKRLSLELQEEQDQSRRVAGELSNRIDKVMDQKAKIEALYLHRYMKSTEVVGSYLREFNEALQDKRRLVKMLKKGEFQEEEIKESLVTTEKYLKLGQEKNRLAEQVEYLSTQNVTQDLRLDHLRGKVDQLTEVLAGYEARVDGCLPVQPSVIYYLMKTREPRDKQTTVMDSILENGLPDGNTSDLTARLERMVTIREVPQCEESKGPLQSGEKLIDKRQGESMIQIDNQDSSVNSVMAEEKREEEIKDEKEMNDDEKGKEEDITHSDKEDVADGVNDSVSDISIPFYLAHTVGSWTGKEYNPTVTKSPKKNTDYIMFGKNK